MTSSIPRLNTASLLQKYGLRPKKNLGQNFLQNPTVLDKIVQIAEVTKEDTVLEIGPGLGSLTRHLAAAAKEVVAVEIDKNLLTVLQATLKNHKNVRVVAGDMLKIHPDTLISAPTYLTVANIPYYITSALLRHLLEYSPRPKRMVLTLQSEVAKRICVPEGKKMSLLALSIQLYGRPKIAAKIPAEAFYPPPKVDSAVIRLDMYAQTRVSPALLDDFFLLAKAGFSQKRKTLRNALAKGLHISTSESEVLLRDAEIDSRRRAETLLFAEWERLCTSYRAMRAERPLARKSR